MDVLRETPQPSAPKEESIYPSLEEEFNPRNFRLENISKIQKEINEQVEHYRLVAKKYKKANKVLEYSVFAMSGVTTAISSVALVTALTGAGVIVGAPLSGVAALSGLASSGLMILSKRFDKKINKHESLYSLALAKENTIKKYVSTAMNNNSVSDNEFRQITEEMENFQNLKKDVRTKFNKNRRKPVDIEKIRDEVKKEYSKKLSRKMSALRKLSD